MALKQTLISWAAATETWDKGEPQASLDHMKEISCPSSKILYNLGCVYLALDDLESATQNFSEAITKDEHMAIAYYVRGCIHFKAKRYPKAIEDFKSCQNRFRSRSVIDYSQLGLKHKLYLCEAEYNIGVCESRLGNFNTAAEHIGIASRCKVELRHRFMKDSLELVMKGELPELAEVPRDAIYRPPKGKVDNMEKRDYLGKAKVISSVEHGDGFSGFVGPKNMVETKVKPAPINTTNQKGIQNMKGTLEELIMSTVTLTTGSAPNSPKTRPKFDRQRSKDDMDIKTKPERPPKSAVLEGAAGALTRNGASRRLPPPPNRPPPKLDRKPLPPEPGNGQGKPQGLVRVEFICNTTHSVEITPGTSLEYLVCTACQHFSLAKDSINLWKKKSDGQQVPILTETEMQETWKETTDSVICLWCYSK